LVEDNLGAPGPRGYVEFHSEAIQGDYEYKVPLKITTMEPGELQRWYAPFERLRCSVFRLACRPGVRSFEVGFWKETGQPGPFTKIAVSVEEGRISVVGLREQGGKLTGRTIGYYYAEARDIASTEAETTNDIVATVGSHGFPVARGNAYLKDCEAALADADWGTRLVAIEGLQAAASDPKLDERVFLLAREDRSAVVRAAAQRYLIGRKHALPPKPIYLETFAQNTDHRWWLDHEPDADIDFDHDGYAMSVLGDTARWSLGSIKYSDFGAENLDIELDGVRKSGDEGSYFGLAACKSVDDFIAFGVTPKGSVYASAWAGGKQSGELVLIGALGAFEMASRSMTRIAVAKRGYSYSISVNGRELGAYVDDRRLALANFGLIAAGRQQVEFDRLAVYAPGE
jgi:hypothetical protein